MALDNLTPAENSTKKIKRVGRGQGSGMGKTASRGNNGQKSRTGYKRKRGFEGGQQPLQRRLPKIGFTSKIEKPYIINVDKIKAVTELAEITVDKIREVHKMASTVVKVKLIGAGAKALTAKIKDENVVFTGMSK
ncbi:50S ribosomal protein L15 [Sulfurospirillum arsenophilum]|uniref:50S ribosomal protein L15 n=1 Tax=Sulfurospirillum arsenophilum TaxID=56698 RepID=UPI0005A77B5B|nr:50S ribosomal protein L15 [Sulfurospirillum arsenophilum]